ncbi:hypothetical protein DICVIV_09502 [Dictyocaulus viviparus]|uniref:Uncharacterized protein n=1 Tax=Dictyocaulus viviparus TaxID=29172 RepID=A0A0D8XKW4_DICVI|nr:hypothetical protein DICVIV_09502 [Dictyocaulus viviparus]
MMDKRENCYITNKIVTNICEAANALCDMPDEIKEVPARHRTISGSFTVMQLTTTNVIMAGWSTEMWLNRVMRSLSSGAVSANFIGATVIIA